MLSMLDPRTGGWPDNEATEVLPQVCPACGGNRKQRKTCPRCGGTGRSLDVGGQKSTRVTAPTATMTPAYVASLLSPIRDEHGTLRVLPQHKIDAAMTAVTGSFTARQAVAERLQMFVMPAQSARWPKGMKEDTRIVKRVLMAHLAAHELTRYPAGFTAIERAEYFGIAEQTWHDAWRERYEPVYVRLLAWVSDVDSHMIAAHRGRREEVAAGS